MRSGKPNVWTVLAGGLRRCRYSLRTLLIVSIVTGVCLGYRPNRRYLAAWFYHQNAAWGWTDQHVGYGYELSWKRTWRGGWTLNYAVIVPHGVDCGFSGGSGLCADKREPRDDGLEICWDGLFIDGRLVRPTEGNRVFVVTAERTLRPVPMSPEDLDPVTTASWEQLRACAWWRSRVDPVIEEEDTRGKAARRVRHEAMEARFRERGSG